MSNETAPAGLPAGMSANAFSSLFQAINGLRNRRALAAMVGCAVTGVLLFGLLFAIAGAFGAFLGWLLCLILIGTGINAAGTLHMDSARGITPRSTVDALVFGLMCIPKLIVLGLALFAVAIGLYIVIAILFFICKIPFVGTALFALVFPASVVVAGVVGFGLFLCMALSLPAIWQGASITRALSQTLAIARSRLVEAVLLLVFVGLLGFAVSFVVFGVLFFGLLPAVGLSATIIGGGGVGAMDGGMGAMGAMGGMMAQGGHAVAGMIGFAVLYAAALSLVSQVNLLGLCLVYLRVVEGLDLTGTEEALRRSFDDARRRTAELGEKAKSAAQRATDGSVAAGSAAAATPFAADPLAPSVGSPPAAVPPAYTPQGFATPPVDTPPSAFAPTPAFAPNPPPAFVAAPPPAFTAAPAPVSPMEVSAPFFPPPEQHTQPAFLGHDHPTEHAAEHGTDIDLPFDDVPAPAPTAYGIPPAYVPPPVPAPPPAAVAPTTCPQCLSPVTADDLFCGVCGYRLK